MRPQETHGMTSTKTRLLHESRARLRHLKVIDFGPRYNLGNIVFSNIPWKTKSRQNMCVLCSCSASSVSFLNFFAHLAIISCITNSPKYKVIEESIRGLHLTPVPGMLLSPKRLITYVYPLLRDGIEQGYIRTLLWKNIDQLRTSFLSSLIDIH